MLSAGFSRSAVECRFPPQADSAAGLFIPGWAVLPIQRAPGVDRVFLQAVRGFRVELPDCALGHSLELQGEFDRG